MGNTEMSKYYFKILYIMPIQEEIFVKKYWKILINFPKFIESHSSKMFNIISFSVVYTFLYILSVVNFTQCKYSSK